MTHRHPAIGLIGIDVDGTLLDSVGRMPDANRDAIHDAVERTMDGSTLARRLLDRDADRQVVFESMDWEHPGRRNYWSRNQSLIAQTVPLEDVTGSNDEAGLAGAIGMFALGGSRF